MSDKVNLNGSEYIQNIPGIYFDASAGLIGKLGDEKVGKYVTRIGFGAGTVVDLTINLAKDPDNPGKVIASTIAANTTYYISGLVADVLVEIAIGTAIASLGIATTPVWLTVAGVGAAVVATTYLGGKAKDFLYKTVYNGINEIENFDFYSPEIYGTITKEEFIAQSASSDPNFCKRIFPQYLNYRQVTTIKNSGETLTDFIKYNNTTKEAEIKANTLEKEKEYVETILQTTQAKQIQLNNVTFNITQANNLTVRNAIDDIPAVSLLLTHILIKPGEKLDLGDKGIYTVKSGDTLSQIANNIDFKEREAV